jgi:hypothetical protein
MKEKLNEGKTYGEIFGKLAEPGRVDYKNLFKTLV